MLFCTFAVRIYISLADLQKKNRSGEKKDREAPVKVWCMHFLPPVFLPIPSFWSPTPRKKKIAPLKTPSFPQKRAFSWRRLRKGSAFTHDNELLFWKTRLSCRGKWANVELCEAVFFYSFVAVGCIAALLDTQRHSKRISVIFSFFPTYLYTTLR